MNTKELVSLTEELRAQFADDPFECLEFWPDGVNIHTMRWLTAAELRLIADYAERAEELCK